MSYAVYGSALTNKKENLFIYAVSTIISLRFEYFPGSKMVRCSLNQNFMYHLKWQTCYQLQTSALWAVCVFMLSTLTFGCKGVERAPVADWALQSH